MRRPIFWFLWPTADPGPLDGDAVESRWLRVCGRGPWRWAFLIAFTALVVTAVSAAISAALARPGLITILLTLVIAVPLIALLARAWVAGSYVNDRGIKVSGVLTTLVIPWSDVISIETAPRTRLLGVPVRVGGEHVGVAWLQGFAATHVETASPDLWLRPQVYAAAADRLRTWLRETRSPDSPT